MGIRTAWRQARQTIKQESDERTELASLRVRRDVYAFVGLLAFSTLAVLILVPLAYATRRTLLTFVCIPALVVVTVFAVQLAQRRHGGNSRELRRAILTQLLIGAPAFFILGIGGMSALVWASDPSSFRVASMWRSLGGSLAVGGLAWLGLYLLYRRIPPATDD